MQDPAEQIQGYDGDDPEESYKSKLMRITWYLIGREGVLNKSRTAFCNEGEGP